jgi:hypothetical protein
MKIRLTAADAARLDCPREIEFDADRLMGREAIALSRIGWSLERLGDAQAGRPVTDSDGNVMYERDENGDIVTKGGKPVFLMAVDPESMLVLAWLAVRRAKGTDVPWDGFDIDLRAFAESVDEDPGKASRPSTRSRTSTSTTRRR